MVFMKNLPTVANKFVNISLIIIDGQFWSVSYNIM